jgi:hypothetical protein
VNSTRNEFANNIILGITAEGAANPKALLMEVDDSVGENVYRNNLYISGHLEGREVGGEETALGDFDPAWFARFSTGPNHDPNAFTPGANSPVLGRGKLLPDATADRNGTARTDPAALGPIEAR